MIGALVAGITGSGGASLSSYESIATASGAGTNTIEFASIPSGFKHLQIRAIMQDGSGNQVLMRFNSDTGSNYAYHKLYGNGATVTASGTASTSSLYVAIYSGYTSNIMTATIIDCLDVFSTTKNKTVRVFTGDDQNGSGYMQIYSGLWMSTASVSNIKIISDGATFATSSKFALYGIKEA